MNKKIASSIRHIETLNPQWCYSQQEAASVMQKWTDDPRAKRLISRIYRNSGIDQRYSVIGDFKPGREADFLNVDKKGNLSEPSTGKRNAIYDRESKRLSVKLGKQTLENCRGLNPQMITHLITVTCTGFTNPGMDIELIRELRLSKNIQRYHIGFMGCYAAFPALHMADQFCAADPEAVVLIVAVELCSLHLQFSAGIDSILANSLFSDGLAAAVVSSRPVAQEERGLRLDGFNSTLLFDGEKDMAWNIGDNGFAITLSSYVPKIIGANVNEIVSGILNSNGLSGDDIGIWAVHPGGKSIVEKVQKGLSLSDDQVSFSREILQKYGNMSSVTILFVLKSILNDLTPGYSHKPICAMSFGPGLTVESALMYPLLPENLPKAATEDTCGNFGAK